MIRPLLLHLANSGSMSHQRAFYAFKRALLARRGTRDGTDVQEIVKECYGYRGGEYGDFQGCTRDRACKCGGSGVWDRRRITLERWRWGRFIFHTPTDVIPPASAPATINGYVKHRRYGRLSKEACLWLYLVSGQFRLFWNEFRVSISYGRYLWPLVLLQRVVNPILWKLARHTCIHCRRKFFTWGSGWCVCKRCRDSPREVDQAEIPF